ncbi:hypothetical protein LINPERHAP2_LOCUS23044 [Linum perenne]
MKTRLNFKQPCRNHGKVGPKVLIQISTKLISTRNLTNCLYQYCMEPMRFCRRNNIFRSIIQADLESRVSTSIFSHE